MNTIIILLVLISVAVLALWGYLIINLAKDKKARRASRKLSEEASQLSRKAKLEAQERMAKAVEKQYGSLQKSLQAEAEATGKEFTKGLHEIAA